MVDDPYHSLSQMARPGIVLYHNSTNEVPTYCELASGPGHYTVQVPYGYTPQTVYWVLAHNLTEVAGRVAADWFQREDKAFIVANFEEQPVKPALICVPRFVAVDRPRNVSFANYGETTPDGLHVKEPEDITRAYYSVTAEERLSGKGRALHSRREYLVLVAARVARRIRQFLRRIMLRFKLL
jgi:hypothetical protein